MTLQHTARSNQTSNELGRLALASFQARSSRGVSQFLPPRYVMNSIDMRLALITTVIGFLGCSTDVSVKSSVQRSHTTRPPIPAKRYAVVVGIDHFQYLPTQPLDFAEAGAHKITTLLRGQGVQVIELLGPNANGQRIRTELTKLLLQTPMASSRDVIFFFSGHGQAKGERKINEAALIAFDCDINNPGPSCLYLSELAAFAKKTKVRSFLVMLDACYAGAFGALPLSGASSSESRIQTSESYRRLSTERARQIITAGGPGEQVYMVGSLEMTVFTKYLADGLSGGAFLSRNGPLLASELATYVKRKVLDHPDIQGKQIPRFYEVPLMTGEYLFYRPNSAEIPSSAGVDARAIPLRYVPKFSIAGQITPRVKKRESDSQSLNFYRRTPGGNCTQRVQISDSACVKDGYKLVAANVTIMSARGGRTNLNPLVTNDRCAVVTGIVQGDDDWLGNCRRPGEISFTISIAAERWNDTALPVFQVNSPESEDRQWVFQYPPDALTSPDYSDLELAFDVKITRRDGDVEKSFHLTEANTESNGVKVSITPAGRLVVDASTAPASP